MTDRTDHPIADPTDHRSPVDAVRADRPTPDHPAPRPVPPVDGETTTDHRPAVLQEREPTALRIGLPIALWVVSVVASWMSADGQLGTADWAGMEGPLRFGLPVILEGFMIVLLLLGYSQGRSCKSPYPLWTLAGLVGAVMVYLNLEHGGSRLGLILGAASAAAILAWFIKLRLDLSKYLIRNHHLAPPRPKLGTLALVAPRLAFRAWIIARRRQITTAERATDLAEVWQILYQDLRDQDYSRKIAGRVAWREIRALTGGMPPPVPTTVRIDRTGIDQSTVATVDPTAVDADRHTDRPDPTPTTRPTADHPTTVGTDRRSPVAGRMRQTDRPATRADLRVVRPAGDGRATGGAAANAAHLRALYPDGLPRNSDGAVIVRQIRDRTNWSHDRAAGAVRAYEAGADLDDSDRARAAA